MNPSQRQQRLGLPKSTSQLAPDGRINGETWVGHEGFGQRDGVELEVDQLRTHGDQEAELEPLNPGKKEVVNEVRSSEKWPRSRERSSQSKMLSSRPSRVRDSTLVREGSFWESA